jgi:hypothetical protein
MAAILAATAHPAEIDLEKLRQSEAEGLLSSLLCQRARLQKQADMALEPGSGSCGGIGREGHHRELAAYGAA